MIHIIWYVYSYLIVYNLIQAALGHELDHNVHIWCLRARSQKLQYIRMAQPPIIFC